jgi:hypothetical protein
LCLKVEEEHSTTTTTTAEAIVHMRGRTQKLETVFRYNDVNEYDPSSD